MGCTNGQKFLLKPATGVRKQLLFLNNKATIAFITKGMKFTDCTACLDITPKVSLPKDLEDSGIITLL